MIQAEKPLLMSDGKSVVLTIVSPSVPPVGVVQLVHGFGDHAGRYVHLDDVLAAEGYAVVAADLRGHGKTPGPRGIADYNRLLDDIREVGRWIQGQFQGLPIFLYGHSLGGNLVLNRLLRHDPAPYRAAVASSPWLRLHKPPGVLKRTLARILAGLPGSFAMESNLHLPDLTHDAAIVGETSRDPLYHGRMGVRLFHQIEAAGEYALEHAATLPLPVLLMAGEDDRIVSGAAIAEFAVKARNRVQFMDFHGMAHELHNEIERIQVFSRVISFLDRNLPETRRGEE